MCIDKNCISYWLPQLEKLKVNVPKTILIKAPEQHEDLLRLFDQEPNKENIEERIKLQEEMIKKYPSRFNIPIPKMEPYEIQKEKYEKALQVLEKLSQDIQNAGEEIGWPIFLRTGQTSGKHLWTDTCYVTDINKVSEHIMNIIEYGECACLFGLSFDIWGVREMLNPITWFNSHRSMPVNTEIRVFSEDGNAICLHPYWPEEAIVNPHIISFNGESYEKHPCNIYKDLLGQMYFQCYEISKEATNIANIITKAIGGAWSVDILLDHERGLVVTDMALAENSYHWKDCPFNKWSN